MESPTSNPGPHFLFYHRQRGMQSCWVLPAHRGTPTSAAPPPVSPQRGWRRGSVWRLEIRSLREAHTETRAFSVLGQVWLRNRQRAGTQTRSSVCGGVGGRQLPPLLLFFWGKCSSGFGGPPDPLPSPQLDAHGDAEAPEGLLPAWWDRQHRHERQ